MIGVGALTRWRQSLAVRSAARFEAIIYVDGPRTKWQRSRRNWKYEEHPGGLRVILPALNEVMPEPHAEDVLQRRSFRHEFSARVWVLTRLKGFDTAKLVGEVRRL